MVKSTTQVIFSQRDISAILVEAVFKLIKVPSKTVTWYKISMQCSMKVSRHLSQQSSHCLCSALYLVHTWLRPYQLPTISSLFSHNTYFYWRDFLVVTSRNGRGIPLSVWLLQRMTSYFWCSIDLLMIFFFVSPLYTDPHEHFNSYTPG